MKMLTPLLLGGWRIAYDQRFRTPQCPLLNARLCLTQRDDCKAEAHITKSLIDAMQNLEARFDIGRGLSSQWRRSAFADKKHGVLLQSSCISQAVWAAYENHSRDEVEDMSILEVRIRSNFEVAEGLDGIDG